ncbi:RNA polymerase sigma factor [Streptomyces sp. NPDC002952]|uniref:RNA polymerase sigma factor n=1 Tax=Streptomyces sp. NPDC002952 TaxID=3364673 RepID=UPI003697BD38
MSDIWDERHSRQLIKLGDESAITRLFSDYRTWMYTVAYSFLNDSELAADAVQQACIQTWLHARSFDPNRGIRPWLKVIIRHAAIDIYRKEHRHSLCLSLDAQTFTAREVAVPDDSEKVLMSQMMQASLKAMHTNERAVIHSYLQGKSQREISRQEGISLGTVNKRVRAGLDIIERTYRAAVA